ncbi:kinase-like domain-containing protein [Polychytrium aggregatum]|uniref:kinase-like domain-containing protein n=1 Tax=Polychytrium aggregatum TaxID=110093 RepID=UPI0022FEE1AD|nr:kinase-like domain-containing protein [Polychytrium aggregatum]KAI9209826.1 kinase-like domain-containing protein [Polychytrium aggregatum]
MSRRSLGSSEVKETLDAQTSELANGQRQLNQYTIQKVLGRGSFGTVHLGFNNDSKYYVAIKEFSKSKLRKIQLSKQGGMFGARGRLGRGRGRGGAVAGGTTHSDMPKPSDNPIDLVRGEIAILKKLNHQNVVKLYEVLDDPTQDSLYMVFELCSKGAVMDVGLDNDSEPLSESEARRYFQGMLLGIEYLHEHDIAHRDIQPDNLLVSADGTLKIVDFGVSEIFTKTSDKLKKSAGSPAFFAPEMCVAQHGELSAKAADIWAMGVTLYCLVFGRLPFRGKSIIDLYESIKNDEPPIPDTADAALADLLRKILDKDPQRRASLDDIRTHIWVNDHGKSPIKSKEQNCVGLVEEITKEEYDAAVKNVATLFTVLKAASVWKSKARTGSSGNLHTPDDH